MKQNEILLATKIRKLAVPIACAVGLGVFGLSPKAEHIVPVAYAQHEAADKLWVADLIKDLKSDNSHTRVNAAGELARISHRNPASVMGALSAMIDAFKDEDPGVRVCAIWTVSEIGKPAVPALIAALKAENHNMRMNAAWALGQIAEKHPEHDLKDAVPALIGMLEHRDAYVRMNSAWALGQIKNPSTLSALHSLMGTERDEKVRRVTEEAIVEITSRKE